MNRELFKNIIIWLLIAILAVIFGRIAYSVINGMKKQKDIYFSISDVALAKQKVPHMLSVQGILEGDPQVKVYPQVPGKFAKNNVVEGQMVNKGDVISYIDRDIIGATFELAPVKSPIRGIVTTRYYIDRGIIVIFDSGAGGGFSKNFQVNKPYPLRC